MVNQFLSLSLFLMLLSFFIVMNSVSGFEDTKAHPVMNSLSMAFSNKARDQEDMAPSYEKNIDRVMNSGDVLEKVEALFEAEITSFDVARNRFGNVMHVRVPVYSLKRALDIPVLDGGSPFQGQGYIRGRGAFLPTLISMLKAAKHERPYRLDMVLNVSGDPAGMHDSEIEKFSEKTKLVAGFAQSLEDAGLPRKYMSVALGEGKNGFIDLYFRPYDSLNIADDIEDLRESGGANE